MCAHTTSAQPAKRGSRRSRCRGSEPIEATLIAGFLFFITFLILNMSMAMFIRSTFQNAVRNGVRYAITGANDTGPCQDDSIKAVVQKNAVGFLNKSISKIHVHWINPISGAVADNDFGNIVEVSVEGYSATPLAPFLTMNYPVLMWARAYDIMESVPSPRPCLTVHE